MKVSIEKNEIVIRMPLINNGDGRPSKSGGTMVIATTSGNINSGVKIKNREIIVGVNAYYKPEK